MIFFNMRHLSSSYFYSYNDPEKLQYTKEKNLKKEVEGRC